MSTTSQSDVRTGEPVHRTFTQSDLALILTRISDVIPSFDLTDLAARQDGVYIGLREDQHGDGRYASVVLPYEDLLSDGCDARAMARAQFDEVVAEEDRVAAEVAAARQRRERAAAKRQRANAKVTRTKREIALLQKLAAKHPQYLPSCA